jgi:gamma-glutamyl phosphate reductase
MAQAARNAQRVLGSSPGDARSRVLHRLSALLAERKDSLIEANELDLIAARRSGLAPALLSRLTLKEDKIATLIQGVAELAKQSDPLGRVLRNTELDEGLELRQVTSALGVLLIIFESRPDAVIQIGALALRSGNAVLLKGGSEAAHSNAALIACLRAALRDEGLPADAVIGIDGREAVADLLHHDELIDLVIPRGSGKLVRSIQDSTRIPVLGHAEGICHTYIDAAAEPAMASRLVIDGKCDYPAACNATETLLVHQDFLPQLKVLGEALDERGVQLIADHRSKEHLASASPASDDDWSMEYGDLRLSVRVVSSIDKAIEHIHRYGSGHTEVIVTDDKTQAERFLSEVDAASVFHNASSRFADGYRYGLGAEVGISTGRIHARGPVGVEGLLTTRWLLRGHGQGAADYGEGKRSFLHRPLPLEDN